MRDRARIHDVASAAGVSITTVSQALNGRGSISRATVERVRHAADALGYRPNRAASSLRNRRSEIVGLVADEIASTPFAGRIVRGAQEEAAARGLTLMLVESNGDAETEQHQLDVLRAHQIDGLVYARTYNRVLEAVPSAAGLPLVIVNGRDAGDRVPSVQPDEHAIGRTATRLLLDAGHTRIAHLTIGATGPGTDGRTAGYREVMANAGLSPLVIAVDGDADAAAGRAAMGRALALDPAPTAVFAFNDPMAMGVFQVAGARGLIIPDDLSVVGVDNLEIIAAQLVPSLTTLELPHAAMGRWAVDTLIGPRTSRSETVAPVLLEAPIVHRASVARRV